MGHLCVFLFCFLDSSNIYPKKWYVGDSKYVYSLCHMSCFDLNFRPIKVEQEN